MNETTNHANGISELDEKLRRIEQRYNHHWELSEGESRGTTEALHGGWLAGAEYVLGVLGYDFDVTDDGKLEIKA